MNARDIMNTNPIIISPDTSLQQAAEKMAQDGVGFLLVGANDELKGTVTDRDLVIRGVAKGCDLKSTTVSEVLTGELLYCREDQPAEDVARNMGSQQVRRMPVLDGNKRIVGVISIGDLAQHLRPEVAGEVLKGVTA